MPPPTWLCQPPPGFLCLCLPADSHLTTPGHTCCGCPCLPACAISLGLFQGHLVAQTFLQHILATANIDDNLQLDEQPVHCALLYSTKGSFNPPHLKPGVFSKANWGNYDVVSQKGTVTAVKHASVFLKRIQALKDQQWIDIYATALENHEMDN
ncbi:hypothetical protein BJV74DRAFT_799718 [Russula compacta]|nr:hypothetical protein BJV74DRAFT_799718 [Russula compacta]